MALRKFWQKEPKAVVPGWASFFTPAQYDAFVTALRQHMGSKRAYELADGVLTLQGEAGEPVQLGLLNLAQKCLMVPVSQYADIISGHFATMIGPHNERDLARSLEERFEAAAPYLKVRLYAEESTASVAEHLVQRPVAPGLVATLVLDLPNTVSTVKPSVAQRWGVPIDALWDRALENVRREEPAAELSHEDLGDGVRVITLVGESFFVTSHLLMLKELLSVVPPHGALVIAPHRHLLIIHPIVSVEVIPTINRLIQLAAMLYKTGPGSLSPNLYWWRDGAVRLLPSRIDDQKLIFLPPTDFIREVLEPLAKEADRM